MIQCSEAIGAAPLPRHLHTTSALAERMLEVFMGSSPECKWLADPMLRGFFDNDFRLLNSQVSFRGQRHPLLMWACQWKFLKEIGWQGEDDIVALLINSGVNVNATSNKGCSALFWAVKYCTVDGVKSLINAGIDVRQKDDYNQTCLKNAIEHPDPAIVRVILEYLPQQSCFLQCLKQENVFLV
eukprot:m.246443 g.246443  ORF g.246443 m.246443 type:complete len:184 (-) comp33847_c2_seq22:2299-2850(-)